MLYENPGAAHAGRSIGAVATLAGSFALLGAVLNATAPDRTGRPPPPAPAPREYTISGLSSIIPSVGVIAGTVGLAGAVLLLLGRAAGRWLVVAASVVELAFFGLWAAAGSYLPILPIGVVATTFGFAVCGPTTRWLEAAKQARSSAA